MRTAKRFLWAFVFFLPLLFIFAGNAYGVVVDDYTPEVTARVVRISFIRGDVQIRRLGDDGVTKQEWERAAVNLPIVEGDEISTGANTVVEIQLDSYKHIRLWENAYLKFTTLRDEGIAVSLPQGTMSVRAYAFDKGNSYFEIDAPDTTVSLQKAGMFRIDAGSEQSGEIRVAATEGGEAKVYTSTSGFTLRNGRTAQIFVTGNYAGDYETTNVSRVTDEFDEWVLQRDAAVAKRLNEAYYDKYYDRDMYGAEDLNENGEWIYTKKYGYVWKPYPNTIARYADWSPYRYGHWRWVPYYGWTWVNDEPWGWATYHHGRWVWEANNWVWCPYSYSRWRRSWWTPGVVRIVTWNGSTICWYPLGWDDDYYDYNRGYRRRNVRVYNNTTIINNNTTIINNPAPTPNPSPTTPVLTPAQINEMRRANAKTPSFQRIPPGAVVAVNAEEFGRETRGGRTLPAQTARQVLTQKPDENQTPPILPQFEQIKGRMSRDILIEKPRIDSREERVKTGATQRETGKSLDQKLEKERIFGNRQPIIVRDDRQTNAPVKTDTDEPRRTGAVNRQPPIKTDETNTETRQVPNDTRRTPNWNPQPSFPPRTTGGGKSDDSDNQTPSEERKPRPRQRDENQTPPIYQPQPEEKPREEERRPRQPSFPRQEEPRPQPRQEESRPRPEPRREEPRPQPQPRQEPPKQEQPKQEQPKQEKPSQPMVRPGKTDKDNRK